MTPLIASLFVLVVVIVIIEVLVLENLPPVGLAPVKVKHDE
jgi:hypothetical protein